METSLQMIWHIVKKMLIIDLLIFAIAGAIWFFSGGLRSADRYGFLLQMLGGITIVLGGMSLMGNLAMAGDPNYQIARTAGQTTSQERLMQEIKDRGPRASFLVLMAGAGVLSILIGTLIQAIFTQANHSP